MKIFNKMWVIALLLAAFVAGPAVNANGLLPDTTAPTVSAANSDINRQTICADSDTTTSPTVSFTTPVNGDTGVALNKKIAVTFSEAMKPSTITKSTFTLKKGTKRVSGKVTYVGVTATFKPAKKLATNTEYTATITTKAKNRAGNKLASDYVWSFTTGSGPDTTAPTVSSTGAANGATGLPINRKATVIFSEAMDPLTITKSTFTLKKGTKRVSGIVTYAGVTATFTPASNLENNTEYTVTITTGAKDLAGNALASDFSISWTTGSSTDTTAPTVSSTGALNGATDLPINRKATVVFSEFMDPLTITTETLTLKQGTTPVSGIVTYAGVTATFTPASNLENNTEYTVTITTGAKDLAGNALASDFSVSWTTGSSTDTTAPTVSSTGAANGATGLPINRKATVVFSEFMDPLTITTETLTLKQGTTPVSGIVTYAGVTATFTPLSNLENNTEYTVTITTGAKDLAGNALASDFSVSWTTGSSTDTTAPTVSSTGAANGATGLPINRKATVVFSEFMDPLTITTETFTLKQGTTPVSGIVTYAGVTATFTPLSNLENNTEYTVTITTGAKDLAGNALASDFSVSWTTGSSTDTTAPTVSFTHPASGATGRPINRKPTATFSEFMDPLTITTETYTLKQGTTPVSGIVTYAGVTATFTPTSDLAANSEYTVTITTGAKDLAGNALASDYIISWTTGSTADTTAPTVSSTGAANGNTDLPINRKPTATFSEAMDPLTITTETYTLKQGTTPVSGIVTYAGVTATFTPTSNLAANTTYTSTITTGAKDLAGNALASDFSVSWTTGSTADTTAPTVSFTGALDGATGLPINRQSTAIFSEAMDPLTITTETYTLKQGTTPVSGIVTYAGVTATFTPASNLENNTEYTSTITTGAKDLAGNALASDYVWSWTTGSSADTTAPTVSSTDPEHDPEGAIGPEGSPINQQVAATFSEEMDPLTITAETFTLGFSAFSGIGSTTVSGDVTYSGVTAIFAPLANLELQTKYTATITTGAKDIAGNALASDKVWNFTTIQGTGGGGGGGGGTTDTTAPTVSSTNPADAATGVAVNQQVAATFSESMNPLTITTATFTLLQGSSTVSGAVTNVGLTATFTPASNLTASTTYTATITTVAKDLAGNALAVNKVWSFTTGTALDTTAPTVSSTVPADGATMVVLNQKVAATFSESMDPLTITTATFTLAQGATPISGAVTYGTVTARFTPDSNLTASTTYTATITTGAKDLAGNALAVNKVWSFTTGAVSGQLTVGLGLAGNYAILAKSAVSTTGSTAVVGDIGISPAAATFITGFGLIMDSTNTFSTSSLVTGRVYAADYTPPTPANLTTAVSNMETAYTDAAGRTLPNATELGAGEIGGMTITPGLYKWSSSVLISTDVTLNGNPEDIWIFQIAGDLTVASGKSVILSGGAQAKNIFWQVAGGAGVGIGTTANMKGILLAQTAIPMNNGASLNGRALAQTAVTLIANTITKPD